MLECWNLGEKNLRPGWHHRKMQTGVLAKLQATEYSTGHFVLTPIFQHSNIPAFQYSSIPGYCGITVKKNLLFWLVCYLATVFLAVAGGCAGKRPRTIDAARFARVRSCEVMRDKKYAYAFFIGHHGPICLRTPVAGLESAPRQPSIEQSAVRAGSERDMHEWQRHRDYLGLLPFIATGELLFFISIPAAGWLLVRWAWLRRRSPYLRYSLILVALHTYLLLPFLLGYAGSPYLELTGPYAPACNVAYSHLLPLFEAPVLVLHGRWWLDTFAPFLDQLETVFPLPLAALTYEGPFHAKTVVIIASRMSCVIVGTVLYCCIGLFTAWIHSRAVEENTEPNHGNT